MQLGKLGGTLLGPGEGIVLGRHAAQSKYKGRIVICGAVSATMRATMRAIMRATMR